ncbi:hypothetical protein [Ligilactobacillus aviarius]
MSNGPLEGINNKIRCKKKCW